MMKRQDFLFFVNSLPNVKMKEMKKTGTWRIYYKSGGRYAHSWDIWNHIKSMYETFYKMPITSDDVGLRVFGKYIEL